jgi:hypothetical protein
MANITNRSPWVVKLTGAPAKKFRLKSQALAYLLSQGYPDPESLPKGALKQLATAFEVQIKRKDRFGTTINESRTFDTWAQAEQWAKSVEQGLEDTIQKYGGFSVEYETMTVKGALDKLHKEHYSSKASASEIAHRTRLLAEWHFPVANRASGLDLPKVNNAIQRYWIGNEKERLFESIDRISPWLRPIVELSLAMAFRRGELVQTARRKRGADGKLSETEVHTGGLRWEHIDWVNKTIDLPKEKNDHTKKNTEYLGRPVPLTRELTRILRPLYQKSETKRGLVFSATTNSVTQAFANCCKKATPPIEKLTFHSLRKISTKDLSKRVKTPMELSRITGHKNIEVLNQRYFMVTVDELRAQLDQTNGSLSFRAWATLAAVFGQDQASHFLEEVRQASSVSAFIEGATVDDIEEIDD